MSRLEPNPQLEAAVFRRLLEHLDSRKDVQNIELMELAGFCRNCLSKWYVAAAQESGIEVDLEQARELVYGMPYRALAGTDNGGHCSNWGEWPNN